MATQKDNGISWTEETWNPIRGCTMVSSACDNCYAMHTAHRFSGKGQPYEGLTRMTSKGPRWTGDIMLVPDKLDQPLRWQRPRRIFVNSMSDLFHEKVPDGYIHAVFAIMAQARQHTFQVLTKRPKRMHQILMGWQADGLTLREGCGIKLPNVWLGVTVEDQASADERIPLLLQTPAAVRWLSCEPLLGSIDLTITPPPPGSRPINGATTSDISGCLPKWQTHPHRAKLRDGINWVVVGGESGANARPMHPEWARSLRDQCVEAGVPFHFKQWGEWRPVGALYPATEAEEIETENASCVGDICMSDDGYIWPDGLQPATTGRPWLMDRVGKKKAGRLLDGREWNEYPETH